LTQNDNTNIIYPFKLSTP